MNRNWKVETLFEPSLAWARRKWRAAEGIAGAGGGDGARTDSVTGARGAAAARLQTLQRASITLGELVPLGERVWPSRVREVEPDTTKRPWCRSFLSLVIMQKLFWTTYMHMHMALTDKKDARTSTRRTRAELRY